MEGCDLAKAFPQADWEAKGMIVDEDNDGDKHLQYFDAEGEPITKPFKFYDTNCCKTMRDHLKDDHNQTNENMFPYFRPTQIRKKTNNSQGRGNSQINAPPRRRRRRRRRQETRESAAGKVPKATSRRQVTKRRNRKPKARQVAQASSSVASVSKSVDSIDRSDEEHETRKPRQKRPRLNDLDNGGNGVAVSVFLFRFLALGLFATFHLNFMSFLLSITLLQRRIPNPDEEDDDDSIVSREESDDVDGTTAGAKPTARKTTSGKAPRAVQPRNAQAVVKAVFASRDCSDVTIVCKDGTVVQAHSALFDRSWKEQHPDGRWETDKSSVVMKAIWRLFALEKLQPNSLERTVCWNCWKAVYEFELDEDLIHVCQEKCIANITLQNVKGFLLTSKLLNATRLFDACFEYACENYIEIATTDSSFGVGVGAELLTEIVSMILVAQGTPHDEDDEHCEAIAHSAGTCPSH